jgi:putative ABC transport system permease protein
MLHHYLRTAFRNLWRSKGYSLINILGLATGIATCLLIFLYIIHELNYEKDIPDYKNIYRVHVSGRFADDFFDVPLTPSGLAPKMKEVLPEIAAATRLEKPGQYTIAYGDMKYYEKKIYFVDSSFFDVFSLPVSRGDLKTSLADPYSIVMTESTARKYFGEEDPIGKTVRANNKVSLKVTAILKDLPDNMHMDFDLLIPVKVILLETNQHDFDQNWGSISLYTYVRFSGPIDKPQIDEKIKLMIRDAFGEEAEKFNMEMIPYLMPLTRIHLHSNLMGELEPSSNISYIYTFSAIALFILAIACINFMNLATARSAKRAREVGLRKVGGATKRQLITQFLSESFLVGVLAGIIALVIAELAFPLFNDLTGLELSVHDYRLPILGMLTVLILVVGLVAGIYPAFVLSSFRPIEAMKGDLFRGHSRVISRNLLVLVQFSVSILLIASTLLVYKQMNFIRGKDLGYQTDNILVVPLRSEEVGKKADVLKNEFLGLPEVMSVSLTDGIPGMSMSGIGFYPEGGDNTSPWIIYIMEVDESFIPAVDMQLLDGRNFAKDFGTDTLSVVINETLRDRLGWEDPIGKKLYQFGQGDDPPGYTIIGVVKNYHFKSLHDAVEPSMMLLRRGEPDFMVLRMKPGPPSLYLEALGQRWDQVEGAFPFDYLFLKEDLTKQYSPEENMSRLFIFFTVMAIFIACLGLFGLASFSAQRRTKEIGIRKVLGAPAGNIVFSLGKEFTRWVLIANIIAWPVAYLLIDRWLQSFAFRINLMDNLWVFPVAGLIALFIALATVMGQAIRAATMNPVEAVKYE